jgi:serine/threonine protein kinase
MNNHDTVTVYSIEEAEGARFPAMGLVDDRALHRDTRRKRLRPRDSPGRTNTDRRRPGGGRCPRLRASQPEAREHRCPVTGQDHDISPEQVEGGPLDGHSDILSLGTLLYETATGRRPFEATSPAVVMATIPSDRPSVVHMMRSDIPPELGRIIGLGREAIR